jgi:hypothetical protein
VLGNVPGAANGSRPGPVRVPVYVCGTTRSPARGTGPANAAVNGAVIGTAAGRAAGATPSAKSGAASCASCRCTFVSLRGFVIGGGINKPSGIGGAETATAGGTITRGRLIVSGPGRPAARGRTLDGRGTAPGTVTLRRRGLGRAAGRGAGAAVPKYDELSTSFDAVDRGHNSAAAIGRPGSDRSSHFAASPSRPGIFGSGTAIGNGTAIGAAVTTTSNAGGVSSGGGGGIDDPPPGIPNAVDPVVQSRYRPPKT